MNDEQIKKEYGLTRAVSIVYLLIGIGFAIASIAGVEIRGIILDWKYDIWIPLFFIITAIGTIRFTIWGRWFSYLVSFFVLYGVPIGTLLGFFMIWHLTKYRSVFNKWY